MCVLHDKAIHRRVVKIMFTVGLNVGEFFHNLTSLLVNYILNIVVLILFLYV